MRHKSKTDRVDELSEEEIIIEKANNDTCTCEIFKKNIDDFKAQIKGM